MNSGTAASVALPERSSLGIMMSTRVAHGGPLVGGEELRRKGSVGGERPLGLADGVGHRIRADRGQRHRGGEEPHGLAAGEFAVGHRAPCFFWSTM